MLFEGCSFAWERPVAFLIFRIFPIFFTRRNANLLTAKAFAKEKKKPKQIYHMTRTGPRAISLENHIRKKVPYEGRARRSDRAGETRTA